MSDTNKWTPPFSASRTYVSCPVCKGANVMASETDTRDLLQSNNSEDEIRAYCPDCHVNLEITCEVDISYHSPRVDPPPPSVQDDFKSDEFSLKLF